MFQGVVQTYRSAWVWIGVVISAVSATSSIENVFEIGLGPYLLVVIEYYRLIAHSFINLFFLWTDWRPPIWVKDISVIAGILLASLIRGHIAFTAWHKRESNLTSSTALDSYFENDLDKRDPDRETFLLLALMAGIMNSELNKFYIFFPIIHLIVILAAALMLIVTGRA